MPEIRSLRAGFSVEQQLREDQEKGIDPEHRQGLEEFNERLRNE